MACEHLRLFPLATLLLAPAAYALEPGGTGQAPADWAFQLTGYVDATYIHTQGEDSTLEVTANPILHVLWRDRLLLEAELEYEATSEGERETELEYAHLDWFINDHATLIVGKFLSPVGYFVPNLHPSWVNKLPSPPPGFGHDGAAPSSDFGVQLRGGVSHSGGRQFNYALYVANGPRLGSEDGALDLMAEGSRTNRDHRYVSGGHLGWLPAPTVELGVSVARGDVQLALTADDVGLPASATGDDEPRRGYRAKGFDFAWQARPRLGFRGEWIRQRVGAASASALPQAQTWRAWYVQGVYRFGGDHWEAVVREGDSSTPHEATTLRQTMLGVNYLVSAQTQVKLGWENNRSDFDEADANRVVLQLAHGF